MTKEQMNTQKSAFKALKLFQTSSLVTGCLKHQKILQPTRTEVRRLKKKHETITLHKVDIFLGLAPDLFFGGGSQWPRIRRCHNQK